MKRETILLIVLGFISCTVKSSLEGTWISTSQQYIIEFKNDTLYRKDIYPHTNNYDIGIIQKVKYYLNGDEIITETGDTIKYEILDKSIKLVSANTSENLRKIGLYKQKRNSDEFNEMLAGKTFSINGQSKIEFLENSQILDYDSIQIFSRKENWTIDFYNEELFLLKTSYPNQFFHIKEIKSNNFTCANYSNEQDNFNFIELEIKANKFNTQIIGNWKRDLIGVSKSYHEFTNEILKIDSTNIYLDKYNRQLRTKWQFNNSNEIMIFQNKNLEKPVLERWPYETWIVYELTENSLVIKRKELFGSTNEIQIIKYNRI